MKKFSFVLFDKCAVCSTRNLHQSSPPPHSYNSDLDGRPIGMARTSMHLWVHQCRNCGYCAPQLSLLLPKAKETVYSQKFQTLRESDKYPDLANKFMCQAFILESAGNLHDASQKYLEAAWVCDDKHEEKLAKECRNKSIQLLLASRNLGYQDCDTDKCEVMLVDMLRRTGRFDEAQIFALKGLESSQSDRAKSFLRQELHLITVHDMTKQAIKQPNSFVVPSNSAIAKPWFLAPKELMLLNNWREVLGITTLICAIMPVAMTFYIASFYFFSEGPLMYGLLIGTVGFLVVRKVFLILVNWLERMLKVTLYHNQ